MITISSSLLSHRSPIGAITGVTSIWLLCMISFDRYNIICNGFNGPKLTTGKAVVLAGISWTISVGFALCPFFGWGNYIMEGILTSCSYDYLTQDFNVSPSQGRQSMHGRLDT